LIHCHAGCSTEAVCAAAGIEMRELFADNASAPRIVAEYDYQNERGGPLFQVVRYEPKDFIIGGRWRFRRADLDAFYEKALHSWDFGGGNDHGD